MNPTDAQYKFDFTLNGNDFSIGLYTLHDAPHNEILTPVMLIKNGAAWDEVSRYDSLWTDIQEDLGEEYLAESMIKKFNKELEKYSAGGEMSFNQKLGAIFLLRLALVGEQIVVKPT